MGLKEILLGTSQPAKAHPYLPRVEMVNIYIPDNEIELAFIKGILDGEHIPYFVRSDHFGTMLVGLQIPMYNQKAVLVDERYAKRASELIKDFLEKIRAEDETTIGPRYSLVEKLRMFVETFAFGWTVPRKGLSKSFPKTDVVPIFVSTAFVIAALLLLNWFLKGFADFYKQNNYF